MSEMDKCREDFESLAVANCADHRYWLKNNVYFNGTTYVLVNHKNEFHCQHSAYFGFAFLMFCQQQKKIDELQNLLEEALRYGLDAYQIKGNDVISIREKIEQALKSE